MSNDDNRKPPHGQFSREQLAGYEPDILQRSVVLIVGAGALAQNLVLDLVLAGIGEIRIVDFDEFEAHNAARSPFYPDATEQAELGLLKAKVVAHKAGSKMLAANPVMRYAVQPIQRLGLGGFSGVDVVVSAVDNPRARAYLSDACRYLGITLIEGGFDGPSISMSCFPATAHEDAGQKPCYRCSNQEVIGTFSCQRYAAEAEAAGVIPAIQTAAAALGALQAEAVIQALHGSHPTGFKRTSLNVRTGESRQYALAFNADCQGIHRPADPVPIETCVTASDTLADLLNVVEAEVGSACQIELPEPFIVDAYCLRCGQVVLVEAPEWAYEMAPRCTDCGGPWTPAGLPPVGHSPTKPSVITASSAPAVLATRCDAAGLPPLALVDASSEDGRMSITFRLSGTVDDLYVSLVSPSRSWPPTHGR